MFFTKVFISLLTGGFLYLNDTLGPYETEIQCKDRGAEIVLDLVDRKDINIDDVGNIETICIKVVKPDESA